MALVIDQSRKLDQVILAFRFEGQTTFVLAEPKHLSPIGGGFWQLGFQLREIMIRAEYPELEAMKRSWSL